MMDDRNGQMKGGRNANNTRNKKFEKIIERTDDWVDQQTRCLKVAIRGSK